MNEEGKKEEIGFIHFVKIKIIFFYNPSKK